MDLLRGAGDPLLAVSPSHAGSRVIAGSTGSDRETRININQDPRRINKGAET